MLTGTSLFLFMLVIAASSMIHASLGFAFSIFGMMFLPSLFATYPQAAAISSVLTVTTSIVVATRERRNIRWKIIFPCVIGYFVTSPIAIHISTILEKDILGRMLGAFLILLGLYFIFLGGKIRINPTVKNGIIAGALSGVGGGFFAVGGPPLVVYFLSSLNSKEEYSATIQACYVLTGSYATVVRILSGIFTVGLLMTTAFGVIAMAVGAMIGYKIMKILPIDKFKKIIYLVMIFSGIKLLLGF
ncbi:MAG: sulfite exporter TauE/SafE family protein [Oscillospiraceae bacterium]|nr:sulfite exporter TauE/SafE family protein [Oscillospiraceae bacterium]